MSRRSRHIELEILWRQHNLKTTSLNIVCAFAWGGCCLICSCFVILFYFYRNWFLWSISHDIDSWRFLIGRKQVRIGLIGPDWSSLPADLQEKSEFGQLTVVSQNPLATVCVLQKRGKNIYDIFCTAYSQSNKVCCIFQGQIEILIFFKKRFKGRALIPPCLSFKPDCVFLTHAC